MTGANSISYLRFSTLPRRHNLQGGPESILMGCSSAFQRDQKKGVLFLSQSKSSAQCSEGFSQEWENKFKKLILLNISMIQTNEIQFQN
jgi:hypothetical protein